MQDSERARIGEKKNNSDSIETRTFQADDGLGCEKYFETDFSKDLFTDECLATLDGPDGWDSGWVLHQQKAQTRICHQQGGGGVIVLCGIIGAKFVGPVRVED